MARSSTARPIVDPLLARPNDEAMGTPSSLAQATAELRARMDQIGPIWCHDIRRHSEIVKQAYAPLLRAAPRDGVVIDRDVAYGPHPRQVVDVFSPTKPRADRAVVLFLHGGAFVRGDKRTTDEIYDNVLIWFARQGYLGINVEYRLAPQAAFPAGASDTAAAMAWAEQRVAGYGGNPERLFLIGHSAGGTHVASYAYDPALGHLGRHAAAIVLISARLRADSSTENPNAPGVRAYFGEVVDRYEALSPVNHGANSNLPVMIAVAEFENPLLDVYGLELAYRIAKARRRAPRFLCMRRHNHMSIVAHFNTDEEVLGREILAFLESVG